MPVGEQSLTTKQLSTGLEPPNEPSIVQRREFRRSLHIREFTSGNSTSRVAAPPVRKAFGISEFHTFGKIASRTSENR